ncbi:MAG TPA: DUF3224 domain-containing protein [Nocardioides sp.]|jgi:hypothetical protein
MTETAHGSFEVTITPQESDDGMGHFAIAKTWSGDLAGSGHGLLLSSGDPAQGRAGYVALEVVEGSLHAPAPASSPASRAPSR